MCVTGIICVCVLIECTDCHFVIYDFYYFLCVFKNVCFISVTVNHYNRTDHSS